MNTFLAILGLIIFAGIVYGVILLVKRSNKK